MKVLRVSPDAGGTNYISVADSVKNLKVAVISNAAEFLLAVEIAYTISKNDIKNKFFSIDIFYSIPVILMSFAFGLSMRSSIPHPTLRLLTPALWSSECRRSAAMLLSVQARIL